jgi:hypothetical protein
MQCFERDKRRVLRRGLQELCDVLDAGVSRPTNQQEHRLDTRPQGAPCKRVWGVTAPEYADAASQSVRRPRAAHGAQRHVHRRHQLSPVSCAGQKKLSGGAEPAVELLVG